MGKLKSVDFGLLWDKADKRIVRVEQFPVYNVPSDLEIFERYQRGERIRSGELLYEWYSRIANKVEAGVRVDRIRVLDLPIPDYQRYEIDWGYAVGEKFGQATWAIRRELYESFCQQCSMIPADFWIFDQKPVLVEYTDDVNYVGTRTLETERDECKWQEFVDVLLGRVFALRDFCNGNNITISTERIDWDQPPPNVSPIM